MIQINVPAVTMTEPKSTLTSGEILRRDEIANLREQLEFIGSCEGGEIATMCWNLQEKLKDLAISEGWTIFKKVTPDEK